LYDLLTVLNLTDGAALVADKFYSLWCTYWCCSSKTERKCL